MDVKYARLRQCGNTTNCTKHRWFRAIYTEVIFNHSLQHIYFCVQILLKFIIKSSVYLWTPNLQESDNVAVPLSVPKIFGLG